MSKIWEGKDGRLHNKNRLMTKWFYEGVADESNAKLELLTVLPQIVYGYGLDDIDLLERKREGVYVFRVSYLSPKEKQKEDSEREDLEEGEWTFSFDTSGGTRRLTNSLKSFAYDETGPAPAFDDIFKNAIGVTGIGNQATVEGVDVVVPALRFQLTARLPSAFLDMKYANMLAGLTGSVNEAGFPKKSMPFLNEEFQPGEVLFVGTSGRYSSAGTVDLTFDFEVKKNLEAFESGGISVFWANGHDHMWFYYAVNVNTTLARTVPQPVYVFVEQVYPRKDLNKIFEAP